MSEKIAILDFGSQYTHLIARRIRELNVHGIVYSYDISVKEISDSKGIILSGGPDSVYEDKAPFPDIALFELDIPILGICYGLQIIGKIMGGKVARSITREYGKMEFEPVNDPLFTGISKPTTVWMSHGDRITEIPEGFVVIGRTVNSDYAAIKSGKIYGIQFHPEVTHSEEGKMILDNFLYNICRVKGDWNTSSFIDIARLEIEEGCKDRKSVIAYSGGVDSTVCSVLSKGILGDRFTPIFVNTGLMRKGEVDEIIDIGKRLNLGLEIVDAEKRFISSLKGVIDPEKKRNIIGEQFIKVFEEEAAKLNAECLIQGTLYPDRIESISSTGPSNVIKTHHNVGAIPDDIELYIVEPLKDFFKDEVRQIAGILSIPEDVYKRHPFPGPGLAVRIIGEVTENRIKILRNVDNIFIKTLKELGLYESIWQAFAVYIPIKTVGVMGDKRSYGNLIGLRAVESEDGMTADWYHFRKEHLNLIARRIINGVEGVNRVVYDISSKPPATIEWE